MRQILLAAIGFCAWTMFAPLVPLHADDESDQLIDKYVGLVIAPRAVQPELTNRNAELFAENLQSRDGAGTDANLICLALIHDDKERVWLSVPAQFIGPRFAGISRKNLAGGDQEFLSLMLHYPDFGSSRKSRNDVEPGGFDSLLLISSVDEKTVAQLFEGSDGLIDNYAPTSRDEYGFAVYDALNLDGRRAYYASYADKRKNVLITCADDSLGISKCELRAETDSGLGLIFVIDETRVEKWPSVVDGLRSFVSSLIVTSKFMESRQCNH